jgi:hypothetical protein
MKLDEDNDSIEGLSILPPTNRRKHHLIPDIDFDFHLINLDETDSLEN